MSSEALAPKIASARPEMTAAIMSQTGLDEDILRRLVHAFYGRVRMDPLLGPVFDARIEDWEPHLERMVDFWSSVALMTGRYHGRPVPVHARLPVDEKHFGRWLELFRQTAQEVCTPAGAVHVITRAERIAESLKIAIRDASGHADRVPVLR